MARAIIGLTVAAGNATNATIFTMPAANEGVISSILATNTTGGSLNFTLTMTRAGIDYVLVNAEAVSANSTTAYNKGETTPLTPLALIQGDIIKGQGSGSGIVVTLSGLRFTTS